jgi:hypothetical protein
VKERKKIELDFVVDALTMVLPTHVTIEVNSIIIHYKHKTFLIANFLVARVISIS